MTPKMKKSIHAVGTSSPPLKKFKTTPSVERILATVFWNHVGVLLWAGMA
jgi:hypothetical protein